jgi:hypothetical protein
VIASLRRRSPLPPVKLSLANVAVLVGESYQTARREIDGQYLWSPKTESNGARSQFYDNTHTLHVGDV